MPTKVIKTARERIAAANRRVKERFVQTMTIALGLFLALTYSSFIQDIVNHYLPFETGSIGIRLLIVTGLTYVVILVMIMLEKLK